MIHSCIDGYAKAPSCFRDFLPFSETPVHAGIMHDINVSFVDVFQNSDIKRRENFVQHFKIIIRRELQRKKNIYNYTTQKKLCPAFVVWNSNFTRYQETTNPIKPIDIGRSRSVLLTSQQVSQFYFRFAYCLNKHALLKQFRLRMLVLSFLAVKWLQRSFQTAYFSLLYWLFGDVICHIEILSSLQPCYIWMVTKVPSAFLWRAFAIDGYPYLLRHLSLDFFRQLAVFTFKTNIMDRRLKSVEKIWADICRKEKAWKLATIRHLKVANVQYIRFSPLLLE